MRRRVRYLHDESTNQRITEIKVRVLWIWRQRSYMNLPTPRKCLHMYLADKWGGIIHATIHHDHVSRFQPQLQVYGVYHIHHFHVDHSPFNHNTGDYEYELLFKRTTILQECLSDTIPFYGFVDNEFSLLKPLLGNDAYIMDIVGCIISLDISPCTNTPTKYADRLLIKLDDLRGSTMDVVFSGKFATQITSYLTKHRNGPYIVVVQFARTRYDNGQIGIRGPKYGTRLLINPGTIELNSFKSRLPMLGCGTTNANQSQLDKYIYPEVTATTSDSATANQPTEANI